MRTLANCFNKIWVPVARVGPQGLTGPWASNRIDWAFKVSCKETNIFCLYIPLLQVSVLSWKERRSRMGPSEPFPGTGTSSTLWLQWIHEDKHVCTLQVRVCAHLPGALAQLDGWLGPGKGLVAFSPLWGQSRGDQLGPPPCQVLPSETNERDSSSRKPAPDL